MYVFCARAACRKTSELTHRSVASAQNQHSFPISSQLPTAVSTATAEPPSPHRATMETPAQTLEERLTVIEKKRASTTQAPMLAKTRRISEAADYQSPRLLPPLTGVFIMLGCQVHRLVPWTRSRTDICKFGFPIADLGNVCSRLRLVQSSWRKGEVHCRVEAQKRGTPHLHYLCYAPRGVLELPPSDGSCPGERKRPRDAESPDGRPNRIATTA